MAMHELYFHLGMLFQLCEHITGQYCLRCWLHLHVHVHSPALLARTDYIHPIYGHLAALGALLFCTCFVQSTAALSLFFIQPMYEYIGISGMYPL
jgi:hypothetical protein